MGDLYTSPSYHQISPLTKSRSDVRSSALKRRKRVILRRNEMLRQFQSNSFAGLSRSSSFSMPLYGYGGGYMARSMSRSGVSMFGRTLQATALTKTAPFTNVGVQRSTPHYTDKFPYVKYSYGNPDTSVSVRSQSDQLYNLSTGLRDLGVRRYLEGRTTTWSSLYTKPSYLTRIERPVAPIRPYVRYMPMDDAVNMFKKRCMTVGTLSKYWLDTPSTRRERDLTSIASLANQGTYRYNTRPARRSFASRLH